MDNRPWVYLIGLRLLMLDEGAFLKAHQGQYPVIFITFKDMKAPTIEDAVDKFNVLIQKLYREHKESLESPKLNGIDKVKFRKYLKGSVSKAELEDVLSSLSQCLYQAYEQKVILLMDEYDTPLTSAYEQGYLELLSQLMRNLFSAALKGNPYLEKGLMTGILWVSQNSLLSGFNNLKVYTV